MLQRHVNVGTDFFVPRNRLQQLARNLIGISVEEAHPAQVFNLCQPLQQYGEAVLQAEVFAVTSGVLTDERDLAHAAGGKTFGLSNYGFKMARTKLTAQLRNNAKAAGMV